jgi:hypothetical protein
MTTILSNSKEVKSKCLDYIGVEWLNVKESWVSEVQESVINEFDVSKYHSKEDFILDYGILGFNCRSITVFDDLKHGVCGRIANTFPLFVNMTYSVDIHSFLHFYIKAIKNEDLLYTLLNIYKSPTSNSFTVYTRLQTVKDKVRNLHPHQDIYCIDCNNNKTMQLLINLLNFLISFDTSDYYKDKTIIENDYSRVNVIFLSNVNSQEHLLLQEINKLFVNTTFIINEI